MRLAFRVWASNLPVVGQRFLRLRKVYIEKMVANVWKVVRKRKSIYAGKI